MWQGVSNFAGHGKFHSKDFGFVISSRLAVDRDPIKFGFNYFSIPASLSTLSNHRTTGGHCGEDYERL